MTVATKYDVEPWTCQGCGKFIYNVAEVGGKQYPVFGAPPANFFNESLTRLCNMCADMLDVIADRKFFVDAQAEFEGNVKRLKKNE